MSKNHSLRATCVFAFVLALVPAMGAAGPKAPSTGSTTSPALHTSVAIDNFGRLNEHYYRGAQPVGRDYDDLAALGVRTVINLTSDDTDPLEQSMVERAGMTYLRIPMTTHEAPTAAELSAFLAAVNDPAQQPVYVHCVGGRHRTGVMTAVYRMTHDGWSGDKAFKEMKQYKYGADFLHQEFKDFVYSYQPAVPDAAKPIDTLVAVSAAAGS
jgi:tyrosine-protein phosphatase SIW14